mmetsp:Transcript_31680/g.98630  ORF Transcript_31680/g.98630 Transcript_31680/m.98630 type:complete len:207 (+) Transcript_31680:504-1124(+)
MATSWAGSWASREWCGHSAWASTPCTSRRRPASCEASRRRPRCGSWHSSTSRGRRTGTSWHGCIALPRTSRAASATIVAEEEEARAEAHRRWRTSPRPRRRTPRRRSSREPLRWWPRPTLATRSPTRPSPTSSPAWAWTPHRPVSCRPCPRRCAASSSRASTPRGRRTATSGAASSALCALSGRSASASTRGWRASSRACPRRRSA